MHTYTYILLCIHLGYHNYCEKKERLGGALPICTSDQFQAPIKLSSSAKKSTLISNCQHLTLNHWHLK